MGGHCDLGGRGVPGRVRCPCPSRASASPLDLATDSHPLDYHPAWPPCSAPSRPCTNFGPVGPTPYPTGRRPFDRPLPRPKSSCSEPHALIAAGQPPNRSTPQIPRSDLVYTEFKPSCPGCSYGDRCRTPAPWVRTYPYNHQRAALQVATTQDHPS